VLANIIDRSGPLHAVSASNGAVLEPGHIYVAVPDHHLLVNDHRIVLSEGPTESGHRPAVNALFRSIALTFGNRAIGVLMSGTLDDGVLGAGAIRMRGGTTVVQHPEDALFKSMPVSALQAGVADHQAAADKIGELLTQLVDRDHEERAMEPEMPAQSMDTMRLENRIAMGSRFASPSDGDDLGPHSGYICPDCNGSLMTMSD
jgi:two-component system chemotaxis response regulator CheB